MKKKIFGLAGFPLGHSFSPLIHNTAFNLLGLDCDYRLFECEPSGLPGLIARLRMESSGFNVTIPHKERIFGLLDHCNDVVEALKCTNTVLVKDGKLHGYNTDIHGIAQTIRQLCNQAPIKSVLIFGAGGAAKAAVYTLAAQFGTHEFHILCRKPEKVWRQNFDFAGEAAIGFYSFDDSKCTDIIASSDLLINCTPLGMHPNVSASPLPEGAELHSGQFVFDMVYNPLRTLFMQQAKKAGAAVIGGLEMLIAQAAESFRIFTGHKMPIDEVRARLTEYIT